MNKNTPITLDEGQRRLEVTHKGKTFTFIFPPDVRNIALIYEGDNVVAACFYGIIYPAELFPERVVMKKFDWIGFLPTIWTAIVSIGIITWFVLTYIATP